MTQKDLPTVVGAAILKLHNEEIQFVTKFDEQVLKEYWRLRMKSARLVQWLARPMEVNCKLFYNRDEFHGVIHDLSKFFTSKLNNVNIDEKASN